VAECGTHAFVAAAVDAYAVGEKTLANRLYPRLRRDELLTADRNFYSFADPAAAAGGEGPPRRDFPLRPGQPETAGSAPGTGHRRGPCRAGTRPRRRSSGPGDRAG
jgi:hypothetical protein